MTADDDPLLDDALAIADRNAAASAASSSDGLRLIDRLVRVFGAHADETREPDAPALFTWGALEVKQSLASGSFGEVFAAWDPTLHRDVALKLRIPEVGALRWLDEARNLARVRHPHVLTVYGADVLEGRAGIWTELISGSTLEDELERNGPFAPAEALRIGRDIASALEAVHAAGLIHGDVKTANIMLEDGEAPRRAVLVDFGTADRALGDDEIPAYLAGTPLTMAPEVLDGKPATGASDVYGLGATLFRLLTGRYPVEAQTIDELKAAHTSSATKPSIRSLAQHVPPRLARVVERATEPAPAKRWANAHAFRRALDDVADPARRIRTRAAAIGAGAAAVAAVAVIAVLASRPGPGPITRGRLTEPTTPEMLREAWSRPGEGGALGGYGYRFAALDFDGDGFDEVIASDARWESDDHTRKGRVVIFRGGPNAIDVSPSETFTGADPDTVMGTALARAGDVNGDGFEDLLVGGETYPGMIGRVQLFLGGQSGRALTPVWCVIGSAYDSALGRSMLAAGDVNGDGFDDVVMAEFRASDPLKEAGVVRLYLGQRSGLSSAPAWTVRGEQERMELGGWMTSVGDVNNDGHDDVLLGAQLWDGVAGVDCGRAQLYLGRDTGLDQSPSWSHEGAAADFLFGCFVGGAGDVNGDGYADMLIAERNFADEGRPERGRVFIFHGGKNGPSSEPDCTVLGPAAYAQFGFHAVGMGDIDGDGFDDVAISAPYYSDGNTKNLGMIEIYRGGPHGCDRTTVWRVIGDRQDAYLGRLLTAGDLNGDHISDLVALASFWGDAIPHRGLLVAYLGQRPKP